MGALIFSSSLLAIPSGDPWSTATKNKTEHSVGEAKSELPLVSRFDKGLLNICHLKLFRLNNLASIMLSNEISIPEASQSKIMHADGYHEKAKQRQIVLRELWKSEKMSVDLKEKVLAILSESEEG